MGNVVDGVSFVIEGVHGNWRDSVSGKDKVTSEEISNVLFTRFVCLENTFGSTNVGTLGMKWGD